MSEHTYIKSDDIDYYHMPYREEGFTYCKRCKRFIDKIEINLNEGWLNDWQQVNCGHCHKAIWVCSFKNSSNIEEKHKKQKRGKSEDIDDGVRVFIKDNKKCFICKKPTNHYDCYATVYCGLINKGKECYICSEKCDKKYNKLIKEKENGRRK